MPAKKGYPIVCGSASTMWCGFRNTGRKRCSGACGRISARFSKAKIVQDSQGACMRRPHPHGERNSAGMVGVAGSRRLEHLELFKEY
jgi:hypothetical protein